MSPLHLRPCRCGTIPLDIMLLYCNISRELLSIKGIVVVQDHGRDRLGSIVHRALSAR